MTASVNIVATGARTPLGLRSAPTAAAHRAGISAMSEHPFMIDRSGNPMTGALDSSLDAAVMGPERLAALAETALREACGVPSVASTSRLQLPMYLALPELRPGFSASEADEVRRLLVQCKNLPIDIAEVSILTDGHAGGLAALERASARIREGTCDACLVGGVDSYFQPDTMEWLDDNRQLAGARSRSGFVPGEGAGFCLLMSERLRTELGLAALARVLTVATAQETMLIKTSDVCLGAALTEVVHRAVGGVAPPAAPIKAMICDINGERYRGEEWGFVCLRLSYAFEDPTAYWCPADCWGDVGAASGPLFAMLACEAAVGGYARGPRTMVWAGSERGLRAAAILDTEIHN